MILRSPMPTDDQGASSRGAPTTTRSISKITKATTKRKKRPRELGRCDVCARVVDDINKRAGTNFRDLNPDGTRPYNLRDLHKRHQEHGVEACLRISRVKATRWIGTEQEVFYRPSTLFRPIHFDEYLNEPDPDQPQRGPRGFEHDPVYQRRQVEDYNRLMREQGRPEIPLPPIPGDER